MVLVLIIFLIFAKPVFASPSVAITTVSDPVIIGDQFEVKFSVVNNDVGNSYHYKVVGVGLTLDTLPDSGCDNRFDSCPTFAIGTSETINVTALAKIISGSGQIKIRIAEADKHATTKDSDLVTLNLISPTPTATPIPTNTPTNTPVPTPTLTPSPTPIPTVTNTPAPSSTPTPPNTPTATKTPTPTHSPTPTKTPTPNPTSINTPTLPAIATATAGPTSTINDLPSTEPPLVLGAVDLTVSISPTPTLIPKKAQVSSFLPGLLIGLGALFLLFPLLLSKLGHGQNS